MSRSTIEKFIESLWEIGTAIENHNLMEITYCRTHGGETRVRTIEPVGILFSEYYFYLAAFIEGIDKDKHFQNPQDNSPPFTASTASRTIRPSTDTLPSGTQTAFRRSEMRKRIQFMYGGELQTIKFEYTGPSLESVLDRLPTAKVLQVTERAG
ncbi:MAG: WYL domain-containing protein [Faecalibacterium prausnitzii]